MFSTRLIIVLSVLSCSFIKMGLAYQHTNIFFEAVVQSNKAYWLLSKPVCDYLDSLKLGPNNSVVYMKLALVYLDQELIDLAIDTLRNAIQIQPNFHEDAYFHLGNALKKKLQLAEAEECYNTVLNLNSTHLHALHNLANIKRDQEYTEEAIQLYTKAIEMHPEFELLHLDLAFAYKNSGRKFKAITSFEHFVKLKPKWLVYGRCEIVICKKYIGYWIDYESYMNEAVNIVAEQIKKNYWPCIDAFTSCVYPMPHSLRMAIAEANAAWFTKKIKKLKNKSPYKYSKRLAPNDRLRIGYVSSDFINNPLLILMQSIPGLHNKSEFETFCYALSPDDNSTFRLKITTESDHFIDLTNVTSNLEAANRIHNDGIHILLDLNGYTKGARTEIFALRPAPIQVMWLGFPDTSGALFMDYIITDKVTSPVELESLYSEKLAYMPQTYIIGNHKQMFIHLRERIILSDVKGCKKNVADNVAILNGIDLSPIIKSTSIKEIIYVINTEYPNSNHTRPTEVILRVAELSNFTQIEDMIVSKKNEISINGAVVQNGLINTDRKARNGEIIMKNIIITTRQQYGLPEDAMVYCCFCKFFKIDPYTFQMWINILRTVPNSILWLLRFPDEAEPNIKNFATNFGIGPDRILFSDLAYYEEHVRRGQLADICLDTPLFNGHTTSLDILWSGTPIITLPGEAFASRVAASILTTLGCPELIAKTEQEYQNIAIRLGTDKEFLRNTRIKVWQARLDSPLFDYSTFTHNLGRLYRAMWDVYQRGDKPKNILSLENY